MGNSIDSKTIEAYEPERIESVHADFLRPLYHCEIEAADDRLYMCYPREILFGPIAALHLGLIRASFQIPGYRANFDCDSHAMTYCTAACGYHGRRSQASPDGFAVGRVAINPIPELGYDIGHRLGTAILPDYTVIYFRRFPTSAAGSVRSNLTTQSET